MDNLLRKVHEEKTLKAESLVKLLGAVKASFPGLHLLLDNLVATANVSDVKGMGTLNSRCLGSQFRGLPGSLDACLDFSALLESYFHVREWDGLFIQTKTVWEHRGRRTVPARKPPICHAMSSVGQKPVGLLPGLWHQ